MKLTVRNVARVEHAEIELNGVTVIAGYNSTGKSTISKSLYAMTDAFSGLEDKVEQERARSIAASLKRMLLSKDEPLFAWKTWEDDIELASKMLVREARISEQLSDEEIREILLSVASGTKPETLDLVDGTVTAGVRMILRRPAETYQKFIVERAIRSVFRGQINPVENAQPAVFSLQNGTHMEAAFTENALTGCKIAHYHGECAIYIGTLNVLDVITQDPENFTYVDRLQELLRRERREDQLTFEEFSQDRENSKIVRDILARVVEGHMIREGGRIRFYDDKLRSNIDFSNLASGLKTFVILQTLIENGVLGEGSMLIIDEPEVNLHPEWQLKFAEVLVLLYKEMGIRMLLNTHSPYFLRAIEIYLAENGAAKEGRYYFMGGEEDRCICTDVTGNTEVIYHALYRPLENL